MTDYYALKILKYLWVCVQLGSEWMAPLVNMYIVYIEKVLDLWD